MNIAVDLIIALLGVSTIVCYTIRGFIRSLFGLVSLVASVVVSWIVTPIFFSDSKYVTRMIAYIAIFVIAYIVLKIVCHLLDRVFKLPLLNTVNRLLGLVLGLVCAYVFMSTFTSVVTIIAELGNGAILGTTRAELESGTMLYGFFSKYGVFSLFDIFYK